MDFDYTPSELMATAGAREVKDREVVAVGWVCLSSLLYCQEDACTQYDYAF
jgi:hypothetical protein